MATFETKTTVGTINQSIKSWSVSIDIKSEVQQSQLGDLNQQFIFNDSTFIYNWKMSAINDSITSVKIYVKDSDRSISNKVNRLFFNTDFEKRTKRTILDFHKKLNDHVENFKVTIKGVSQLEPTYCVYVPLKGTQIEKAKGMMRNYGLLSSFIVEKNIELNGQPVIEITNWDIKTDSIEYNFCYPIKKQDSLPSHKLIKYKLLKGSKAIKAIYNGNYITSDRAWYSLEAYANKNDIEIELKPIEIFYNNPNMGSNELEWKAEVYMPIK